MWILEGYKHWDHSTRWLFSEQSWCDKTWEHESDFRLCQLLTFHVTSVTSLTFLRLDFLIHENLIKIFSVMSTFHADIGINEMIYFEMRALKAIRWNTDIRMIKFSKCLFLHSWHCSRLYKENQKGSLPLEKSTFFHEESYNTRIWFWGFSCRV